MTIQSRRGFLKSVALLGGAVVLGPLDVLGAEDGTVPEISLARWGGELTPAVDLKPVATKLTEQAIRALGGMERFVSKGDVVWIKPNIGWNRKPELAACTNPDVVATLVRLSLDAGAKKVKVGDNTCHEPRSTYRSSGIEAAAKEAGAEIVYLDENRFREVSLKGNRLEKWEVYPEIIETDLVINVPIVKHHNLSNATLCMKNYMGIIGGQRNTWHQELPACLVDITAFMKPRLCVLDAVRILTNHGPTGGNPADVQRPGVVAAGTDIVALDAFGAELLGHDPHQIKTVTAAAEAGLGTLNYRSLPLEEALVS